MLTDRQQFKLGFLQACARAGLNLGETAELVKAGTALVREGLEKQAFNPLDLALSAGKSLVGAGTGAAGELARWVVPLSLVAPPVLGGTAAYAAAKLSDVNDEDITDVKLQEKLDAYRRATEIARARTAQTQQQRQQQASGRRKGYGPL